jgi:beta-lactamase regulating signal transducer with metallopeptidase domain
MTGTIPLLKAVLEASWQGSIVILLILAVRPLLGLRVPARWRYLLWTFVLVRLLVPAFMLPPSPASLQNIPAVDRPIERAQISLDNDFAGSLIAGERRTVEPATTRFSGPPDSLPSLPAAPPRKMPWWRIAAIIWLSGAALFAVWILGATIRLQRRLRRENGSVDPAIVKVWESCCARFSTKHLPRLLAASWVDSPALVGVTRPVLLIPSQTQGIFLAEDWEHIFAHELAHLRRRDHWVQGLQLLALCAHWFNPLVWLGFRFLRADRELATDELALKRLAGNRSAAYGGTLLKVLSGRSIDSRQPGMVGILEDGAQLKQRLRRIALFGPRRAIGSAVGLAVAIIFAAAVLGRQVNQPDVPKSLPEQGTDPDASPQVGLLGLAAARGDLARMQALIDAGADVNECSKYLGTPLCLAIYSGQIKAVQFLLDHGANINCFDHDGMTPYVSAKFLDWNIDVSSRWSQIEGMNGAEARKTIDGILAILSKYKQDVNYRNKDGETALFPAAATGNFATLGIFVTQGANINLQRMDGMTPLMLAIVNQPKNPPLNVESNEKTGERKQSSRGLFVQMLLEKGADLTLRNNAGKTALDLARENGNEEILSLLQPSKKSDAARQPAPPAQEPAVPSSPSTHWQSQSLSNLPGDRNPPA